MDKIIWKFFRFVLKEMCIFIKRKSHQSMLSQKSLVNSYPVFLHIPALSPIFLFKTQIKSSFNVSQYQAQSSSVSELHWDLDRMADIIHFDSQLLVILEETLK